MSVPPSRPPGKLPRFGARRAVRWVQAWALRRPSPRGLVWLAGSGVVHALLLALLLFWPDPRPRAPTDLPAPAFDIVFDGSTPEEASGEAPPGEEVAPGAIPAPPPVPPVETPPAEVPPIQAPPVPPPPAPAPPPPQPPPPGPAPAPSPVAPPRVAQPPPPPAPSLSAEIPSLPAPPPAPPRPEAPPAQDSPPPLPEAAEFLAPPTELRLSERFALPLPPAATPAQPTPSQPPQPRPLPGVFLPRGADLGSPPGAPSPSGRPQGRGLDLSVDPRFAEGDARTDPSVRVEGAQVGANWRAAFRRWLEQNISYPQQAAMRGEDGTVRVQIVANPDGTVRSVRLVGPSTSPSLNYATTFPFQGARIPAFPPPADPNGVTVDLTVNYILRRR